MITLSRYFGIKKSFWGGLALLILLSLLLQNVGGNAYCSLTARHSMSIASPSVILEDGTAGSNTIYTNSTSAKVSITAPAFFETTYDYVLKVNNTASDSWQIRLKKYSDSNVNRLQNCTIYFHNSTDGTSSQISIENGTYTQDTGTWYSLPSLTIIYIAATVEAKDTGTSYVYVYLEIRAPNTSVYSQYIITLEIT